jgi:SNF2 family DNA or RNA helicase
MDVVTAVKEHFGDLAIIHHGQLSDDVREKAKETFQKEDCLARVFVSTRPSLAVGATLTRASRVVFNDLPWNMADIQQAEDRTHRIGQINPVVVHWVVAENSEFDSNLTDIIEQKAKIQKAVTEGKKLTADELNQLQQPVSFKDLIAKKTEVVK